MDRARAAEIAEQHIARLSTRSFEMLQLLVDEPERHEAQGTAGRIWQVDIEAFWELTPGGNLRVIVSVDGGGISAWVPVTRAFVISPSGAFVDEQ